MSPAGPAKAQMQMHKRMASAAFLVTMTATQASQWNTDHQRHDKQTLKAWTQAAVMDDLVTRRKASRIAS